MQDIDTYLYPSNAAGEVKGESMSEESATTKGDEKFTIKAVKPGFYLLQLEVFMGAEATWTGKVELTNTVPKPAAPAVEVPAETPAPAPTQVEPAPVAPQQPAPPAQPYNADEPKPAAKKPSKKAACQKKAKKIRNAKKRRAALKRCAKMKSKR